MNLHFLAKVAPLQVGPAKLRQDQDVVTHWANGACEGHACQQNGRRQQKPSEIPSRDEDQLLEQFCHPISEEEVDDVAAQRGIPPPSRIYRPVRRAQGKKSGLQRGNRQLHYLDLLIHYVPFKLRGGRKRVVMFCKRF